MKHYKIVNRTRFICFEIVLFITVFLIAGALFSRVTAGADSRKNCTEVRVVAGDTLWDIAKEYGSDKKDIRQVVSDICRLNHLRADELRPGQIIMVPRD